MIITRAPLRVTFGGGGTDLPSYYRKFGGELVTAGIDKYIYIGLHQIFRNEYIIKYSEFEKVTEASQIKHPIIREALMSHNVKPEIEIVSLADIPDGTGLGSSSTFTVALLKAIAFYKKENVINQSLAEEACDIEINRLKAPIGKQDQYASAFGGITCFKFHTDDSVEIIPVRLSTESVEKLEDHLLLFFTGYSRSASQMLSDQKKKSENDDKSMLDNLHYTKELGIRSRIALEKNDLNLFAELMHEHWENKRKRTQGMSNPAIDTAYDEARKAGAIGGKLIGAGAGGFLMFYTEKPQALREKMSHLGLREVRFRFDFEGAKVVSQS